MTGKHQSRTGDERLIAHAEGSGGRPKSAHNPWSKVLDLIDTSGWKAC